MEQVPEPSKDELLERRLMRQFRVPVVVEIFSEFKSDNVIEFPSKQEPEDIVA
jgi:hypothetical protein